jgi:hypothetical protein
MCASVTLSLGSRVTEETSSSNFKLETQTMSTPQDALMKLIAERKAQTAGQKTIKPADGRNTYRILPSWRGAGGQFWHDFGQHFIKDAAGVVKAVYVCAEKTFGRTCDVCSSLSHASVQAADAMVLKNINDAQATGRVLLNVLDLSGKPGVDPTKPQILEVAPSVFNGLKQVGGIIGLFGDWPGLLELDPANGAMNIVIEKSGTGKDTRYAVQVAPGATKLDPTILSKLNNLDEYVSQENEAGKARALANIAAVTGVAPAALSGPATTALLPSSVAASLDAAQNEALRALDGLSGSVASAPVVAPVAPAAYAAPIVTQPMITTATVAVGTAPVIGVTAPVVATPVAAPVAVAAAVAAPAPAVMSTDAAANAELEALLAQIN